MKKFRHNATKNFYIENKHHYANYSASGNADSKRLYPSIFASVIQISSFIRASIGATPKRFLAVNRRKVFNVFPPFLRHRQQQKSGLRKLGQTTWNEYRLNIRKVLAERMKTSAGKQGEGR